MQALDRAAALVASRPVLSADADVSALLRQYDEALLNAVHRGDRATWEKFTTPDFAYIEAAKILRRNAFLHGLEEDAKSRWRSAVTASAALAIRRSWSMRTKCRPIPCARRGPAGAS